MSLAILVDHNSQPVGVAAAPLVVAEADIEFECATGTGMASGDHVVVPAVPGKKIKVFALSVFAPTSTALVNIQFTDGPGGPPLFTVPAQSPNQAVFTFGLAVGKPFYLFGTSAGNDLNMNLDAATTKVVVNASFWLD